jgi:hypothetical protein
MVRSSSEILGICLLLLLLLAGGTFAAGGLVPVDKVFSAVAMVKSAKSSTLRKTAGQGQTPVQGVGNGALYPTLPALNQVIWQIWDTLMVPSAWHNMTMEYLIHDALGNVIADSEFQWNGNQNVWQENEAAIYSYFAKDKISSVVKTSLQPNGVWVNAALDSFYYDSKDSVVSFTFFDWDNSAGWGSSVAGHLSYNKYGQLDTLQAHSTNTPNATVVVTYSYTPDGKFLCEDEHAPATTPTRDMHSYPESSTEIVVTQDTNYTDSGPPWIAVDSTISQYTQSGQISGRKEYCSPKPPFVGEGLVLYSTDSTTFDAYDRPLQTLHHAYYETIALRNTADTSRTLYIYGSGNATSPLAFPAARRSILLITRIGSEELRVTGLPQMHEPITLTFYNLNGRVLGSWNVASNQMQNAIVSFRQPMSAACIMCRVRQQNKEEQYVRFLESK